MSTSENKRDIDWGLLIFGGLFILVGLYLLTKPVDVLISFAWLMGFLILFQGIFQLLFNNGGRKGKGIYITLGIINIIIGLIILFNIVASTVALVYLFAIWVIIVSVGDLIISSHFKYKTGAIYWTLVILGVIGLLLGISLLFNPLTGAMVLSFLITFSFAVLGVQMIVRAFR